MSSFGNCYEFGKEGAKDVEKFFEYKGWRYTATDDLPGSRGLQLTHGDYLVTAPEGNQFYVEVKTEPDYANPYARNFYLETWSNRPYRRGWMDNLSSSCRLLLYYFRIPGDLYVMEFAALREWSFGKNIADDEARIYDYAEKSQRRNEQPNLTCGRIVPVDVILAAIPCKHYRFSAGEFELVASHSNKGVEWPRKVVSRKRATSQARAMSAEMAATK